MALTDLLLSPCVLGPVFVIKNHNQVTHHHIQHLAKHLPGQLWTCYTTATFNAELTSQAASIKMLRRYMFLR